MGLTRDFFKFTSAYAGELMDNVRGKYKDRTKTKKSKQKAVNKRRAANKQAAKARRKK